MICNGVLNGIFVAVFHWGAASVAIATSISAIVNYAILSQSLKKRLDRADPLFFTRDFATHLLVSLFAASLCCGVEYLTWGSITAFQILGGKGELFGFIESLQRVALLSFTFLTGWLGMGWIVGMDIPLPVPMPVPVPDSK
jgi:hypothetical protein